MLDGDKRAANAERQRRYRERQKNRQTGAQRRINQYVVEGAYFALERLARHRGATQKEILERLLMGAERSTLEEMSEDEQERYFGG